MRITSRAARFDLHGMWQQVVRLAGGAVQGPATRLASLGMQGCLHLYVHPTRAAPLGWVSSLYSQPVSQRLRSVSGDALTLSVDALELERPRNANLMSSLQCAVRAKT